MDLYDRIEERIAGMGINKRELADKAGVPYSTLISAFTRRSTSFSVEHIQKIADALDTTVDYLLRGFVKVNGIVFDPINNPIAIDESMAQIDDLQKDFRRKKITGIVRILNTLGFAELEAADKIIKALQGIQTHVSDDNGGANDA